MEDFHCVHNCQLERKFHPVRDITEIKYNILNLPYEVTFLDGSKIKVVYDGDGQVWRKILTSTTDTLPNGQYTMTIDYIDGFEYHDEVFASYTHPQGRVAPGPDGINCEYFLRDHLGSVRVIYADIDRDRSVDFNEEECELLEEFHYYPFALPAGAFDENRSLSGLRWRRRGQEMTGMWNNMREDQYRNRHTYNGKPAQTEMGWDWLNFGARYYDPVVGRFTGVDPISDQFAHVSTYNYAENSPIAHIDLWGLQAYSAIKDECSFFTSMQKMSLSLIQLADDGLTFAGDGLKSLFNKILGPEGTPSPESYHSSGNTIGEGFEVLTNNKSNANGAMGTAHADRSTAIIMVDEMLFPNNSILGQAAIEASPAVNFIEKFGSAAEASGKVYGKGGKPDKTTGIDTLKGQFGAPDTLKTTYYNNPRSSGKLGSSHHSMLPLKEKKN